jgi:hypothetical protein
MSGIKAPDDWIGKVVDTIDVLVFIRAQVRAGVGLEVFFGRVDVDRFRAFVSGVHFHAFCGGLKADRYLLFLKWLREQKKETSAAGWVESLLRAANGDHRVAILAMLDLCAEFAGQC